MVQKEYEVNPNTRVPGVHKAPKINRDELRVVNIVGRAPSGLVIPPYGELWGLNHSWAYGHDFDKLFVIDGMDAMLKACPSEQIPQEEFKDYLRKNKHIELISAYAEKVTDKTTVDGKLVEEVLAQCVVFPKHLTYNLIPGTYFTSSVAHILAYCAVQEEMGFKKIDTINLYGIELWGSFDDDEYTSQRECVDFWLAYLYGKGIQIMLPAYVLKIAGSQNNLYGYIRK